MLPVLKMKAINCAGSTGTTVNNYTRKELELKCFVLHGFICLVKLHMYMHVLKEKQPNIVHKDMS